MQETKRLLEARKNCKAKKPEFLRQDVYKKAKLSRSSWRKPKGLHSKIREQRKGRRRLPEQGYRSPKEVRGLHPTGLNAVLVNNISDAEKIINTPNKESIGAIIGKVGQKKKVMLLEKLTQQKIKILNVKNPAKEIQAVKTKFDQKIKDKKAKAAEKDKKKEAKAKDTIEEKVSEEEKKEVEKKEMDKLLSKKD